MYANRQKVKNKDQVPLTSKVLDYRPRNPS